MASYHCSVKVLSRGKGRSSVQFSAYIGGEKLKDERLGEVFDKTSKDEVCYNEMMFADRVPEHLRSQSEFWNEVERIEKQSNAQVSRTWEIALPKELTREQNVDLAKEFAKSLIEEDGLCACQVAFHDKDGNPHAHIMAPMRDMNDKGEWLSKEKKDYALDDKGERIPIIDPRTGQQKVDKRNRKQWQRVYVERNEWNSKEYIHKWRERAADLQNKALERNGHEQRVDHRSYKDQGLDITPTIHEGYTAQRMGTASERVRRNVEIMQERALAEEIKRDESRVSSLTEQFSKFKERCADVQKIIGSGIERIKQSIERRTTAGADRLDSGHDRQLTATRYRAAIDKRRTEQRESAIARKDRDSNKLGFEFKPNRRKRSKVRSKDEDFER